MQGVLGEPSLDWGAKAEFAGEGSGRVSEDAVPPSWEVAGGGHQGWSPRPLAPGWTPRRRFKGPMFTFTAMLRSSRTLTSLTRRLVCVPWSKNTHHSRVAAARGRRSGLAWRPPRRGGPHSPWPASPFPRLLLTSSCALPARTRRRRGCREPHGPLTPLRRSAAPGSSRRLPLLSWRFPVQTGRGLPSGGNARGCCRLQSASAVNPPEVPRHRGAAESWSAPLSRGDTNHSSVSVTDPPEGH